MQLSNLIPTHNELRSMEVVELWKQFFFDGKVLRCQPVNLSEIEGEIYIHDGHHRLAGLWLAGGRTLYEGEYTLRKFTVKDYLTINWTRGYVTPFDPREQVRIADFKDIKERILESEWDEDFIYSNRFLWSEDRKISSLEELVNESNR